jgi:ribA/ribD-fused uncharacterized protein
MKDYHFFWGGEFSQWYESPFHDPLTGMDFNCCEQYMMYKKAELFGDTVSMALIMATNNPKQQKAYGRKVANYDDAKWDEVCRTFVTYGNYLKFTQNHDLKQILIDTGDKILVEASPYDAKWGIGIGVGDIDVTNTASWGLNWLGESIMEVRDQIKSGGTL